MAETASSKRSLSADLKKQKSLPTYIKFDPDKTQVVRLKKIGKKVYQDCDVYIGPKIDNDSWTFEESEWVNPFHFMEADRKTVLECYKQHVLNDTKLRNKLGSLKGKRLGCFCNNMEFCHGTVLKNLVKSYSQKFEKANERFIFFKGETHPLSNLYHTSIEHPSRQYVFSCGEQYRLWLAAKRFNKKCFLPMLQDKDMRDPYSLGNLGRMLFQSIQMSGEKYTRCQQIEDMITVLELRYKEDWSFKHFCVNNLKKGMIVVEATRSNFWGCGIDIRSIGGPALEDEDMPDTVFSINFPGENVLGFCILYVAARNRANESLCKAVDEECDVPKYQWRDQYQSYLQNMSKLDIDRAQSNNADSPESRKMSNPGLQYLIQLRDGLCKEEKYSNLAKGLSSVIGVIYTKEIFIDRNR